MRDLTRAAMGKAARVGAAVLFLFAASLPGAAQPASSAQRDAGPRAGATRLKPPPKQARLSKRPPAVSASPISLRPYYIEFRSRVGAGYGHAYVIHGELDARGNIKSRSFAGLYSTAEAMLMVGHALPVPATTAGHPLDRDERRVTASFRLTLTPDEYQRVAAVVRQAQESNPLWHISLNNCNNFVGAIAGGIGLRTPHSTLVLPKEYVETLRSLNAAALGPQSAGRSF